MKTLYLARHAKSSWKDSSLSDRDRPLNKRGKRDAPQMADYLKNKIPSPDVFIGSPSRRTRDTATHFLQGFDKLASDLVLEEGLFHGDESNFNQVIKTIRNDHQSAMLFVHNPGITDYVNELTSSNILNIPTCGVAGIQLETNRWVDVTKCQAKLLFYYYPKGLNLHS